MFQEPERVYQPAVATEGWGGPGAYVTERQGRVASRYPIPTLLCTAVGWAKLVARESINYLPARQLYNF